MTKLKHDSDFMEIFSEYLIEKMKDVFVTKEDIKHLPTKDEYYAREDETMGELKIIREEVIVGGEQTRRNTNDIEELKKVVFKN